MDHTSLPALTLCERLVEYARENASAVHPAFVGLLERRRTIGSDYFATVDGDPSYLTDLRMKRYADPAVFFMDNVLRLGASAPTDLALADHLQADACVAAVRRTVLGRAVGVRRYDFGTWVRGAVVERPEVVSHVLCFYVNSLGSWDDAHGVALEVLQARVSARGDESARLLVLCAYACAIAASDERARVLYERGVGGLPRAFDRFFAHLRMATAELKRFKDDGRYVAALLRASHEAARLDLEGHTAEDAAFARSLISNLRALACLRCGDFEGASALVAEASRTIGALPSERLTLRPAVAGRYRFMVELNRGLLDARRGDWTSAARRFAEALKMAREDDPDSVSEGLAVLGYALLRLGRPGTARAALEEAEHLLALDARPTSLAQVRALLAVSCKESGDETSAAGWLARHG